MPQDYSNSNKKKAPPEKKHIEKVVTGEVVVQKRSLGRKFKDTFVAMDARSVLSGIVAGVLIPALRNTIVDATNRGIEQMMYGDSATRRRGTMYGSRTTYNNPISRPYPRDEVMRTRRPQPALGSSTARSRDDFILSSREEAEVVLERMNDILDAYDVVTVGDLNELVGHPSNHVDNKWGWVVLGGVDIRQIREGWLIDFPPAEPL